MRTARITSTRRGQRGLRQVQRQCGLLRGLGVGVDQRERNLTNKEKEIESDPFLATRVMAGIDNLKGSGYEPANAFIRVLKPVLVTASMAAAIFFGIMLGNLSQPVTDREIIPVELALIDDAAIETVNILLNE